MLLQLGMQRVDVSRRVIAERDAALVGNDDDTNAGAVEGGDCGLDAGQNMEVAPAADVGALGRLAVDDAVTVEKNAADVMEASCHQIAFVRCPAASGPPESFSPLRAQAVTSMITESHPETALGLP